MSVPPASLCGIALSQAGRLTYLQPLSASKLDAVPQRISRGLDTEQPSHPVHALHGEHEGLGHQLGRRGVEVAEP